MNRHHASAQPRAWFRGSPIVALAILILLFPAATTAGRLGATSSDHLERYPNAIAVIGDTGATGWGSDPVHGLRDQPQNSWATGTNPAVDSIYTRTLAAEPGVGTHETNLAEDDPSSAELAAQVRKLAALRPRPELVILQFNDRELATCDGNDEANYAAAGSKWLAGLQSIAKALPTARILLVSGWGVSYATPWGSIDSYVNYLDGLDKNARLKHAGKGLCQLVDAPSGRVVPARVAYVKKIWAGYEAQKAAACAQVPQCRYDHGTAMRIAVTAADLTPGGDGMTVAGNAQLAAAEWKAVAGFIDRFPAS
jgi:hypothetical protein